MTNLAQRFQHFAASECHNSSPLYERLALAVAADSDLLALASHCAAGQPAPNLLFAAIHHLLLSDNRPASLRAFYPDISPPTQDSADPFPAFKSFCLERSDEIMELLRTKLVQTNEVRRSAILLPAFAEVWQRGGYRPLALVEIGASAGLNLLGDHYRYEYRTDGSAVSKIGPVDALVTLICESRGEPLPPEEYPPIAFRLGLDLNPIDVRDTDAVAWLFALIWPEHADRRKLLADAVNVARLDPPHLLRGDANGLLPELLPNVPAETTLCVFHSHTVNQFPPEARERLRQILRDASRRRPIWRIGVEGASSEPSPIMTLLRYAGGVEEDSILLARADAHGRWLEWLAPSTTPT